MSKEEDRKQTSFHLSGIPTPEDQQNAGATDAIAKAVEAVMDHIEELFTGEPAAAKHQGKADRKENEHRRENRKKPPNW